MNVPIEHLVESQSLEPDALLKLFEITLNDKSTVLRLVNRPGGEWDARLWEEWPIQLTGDRRTGGDESIRPSLQIYNPEGQFNVYVQAGLLEGSNVFMHLVQRKHFEDDISLSVRRGWYISQVAEQTSQSITCQLRSFHDGPHAQIPGRVFVAPEFPLVRLR